MTLWATAGDIGPPLLVGYIDGGVGCLRPARLEQDLRLIRHLDDAGGRGLDDAGEEGAAVGRAADDLGDRQPENVDLCVEGALLRGDRDGVAGDDLLGGELRAQVFGRGL